MNKINWKVRFKNKVWVTSFFSLIIGFAFSMMNLLDIYPSFSKSQVIEIMQQVLTFLGLIGIIQDPTTAGMGDSARALGYSKPWNDEEDGPNAEEQ